MALLSERWHRVAMLRPRLVPQLRVQRQRVRGATWYLLLDPASGRSCRLNPAAYALAGRLAGEATVQQLWEALQSGAAEPPTQDETVDMLAQLRECGLVEFDRSADFARLLPHLARGAGAARRFDPIAWRLPLADPAGLLRRLQPLGRLLFSRAGALAWLVALAWLLAQAALQAPTLAAYADTVFGSARFALALALVWLPVKLLHELAHALAVRRFGGAVHEAGVTLMMGLPVPYVDASAATGFAARGQRLLVGGAGIAAELAIAAGALALWSATADGSLRELAFALLVVCGISTLLFNANPLQRLDGYHMLVDALQLPNLATRSRAWWQQWLQRRVLALPEVEPMPLARGERAWLVAYAPLAWAWLLLIALLGALWLARFSAVLGMLAALAFGWQALLRPPWRLWQTLRRAALAAGGARRRLRALLAGVGALVAVVIALPLPQHTLALGVVWPAEQAQLRPQTEGFVQRLYKADGDRVEAGEAVIELVNPRLAAQLQRQEARVAALQSELYAALPGDSARSADLDAELAAAQAELARLRERDSGLQLRARVAGTLALPRAADLDGRYLRQGELIGQVLSGAPPELRVALPDDRAARWSEGLRRIEVRLADAPARVHTATLAHDGTAAVHELPSPALGRPHGGLIETDPQDREGRRTAQPVLLLDVRLAELPPGAERLGTRSWVRFDQGLAPLAWQWARALKRRWAQQANPQA